jgi:uncharacterized Zn-binding protein involved in type VI secretion
MTGEITNFTMGKPAARLTDMTAHGGTISGPGCPTVMIGKMPAACLGDMHVCPMVTPAVPPIPHVGGPITLGSTGVFIGKKPAARMGDMAVCTGPPSSAILGCFQVMIGEAGSGSQAGPAGSASAAKSAKIKGPKKIKPFPVEKKESSTENHFIDCEFTDSAGKPLPGVQYRITDPDNKEIIGTSSSEGRARHDGYAKKGSFKAEVMTVANSKWAKTDGKPGETINIKADIDGFKDIKEAVIQFFSAGTEGMQLIDTAKAPIKNKKIDLSWKLPDAEQHALNESMFCVIAENQLSVSGRLKVRDTAEIELLDDGGEPIAGAEYTMTFSDGSVRKGKLDSQGKAKEKDIPPGDYEVEFKEYPEPAQLDG